MSQSEAGSITIHSYLHTLVLKYQFFSLIDSRWELEDLYSKWSSQDHL